MSDGITATAEQLVIMEAATLCMAHHRAEASRKNEAQIAAWADVEIGWWWNRHKRGLEAARKIQTNSWFLAGSWDTSRANRADEIHRVVSSPDLTDIRLEEADISLLRDFLTG